MIFWAPDFNSRKNEETNGTYGYDESPRQPEKISLRLAWISPSYIYVSKNMILTDEALGRSAM